MNKIIKRGTEEASVAKSLTLQFLEEAAFQYKRLGPVKPASKKSAKPIQKGNAQADRKGRTAKGRN